MPLSKERILKYDELEKRFINTPLIEIKGEPFENHNGNRIFVKKRKL